MRRYAASILIPLLVAGCAPHFGPNAIHGVTFYSPGAGNIDFSDRGIRTGLTEAGYDGDVSTFVWTISLNPLIDQTVRLNAHIRAVQLARVIEEYIDKYPDRPVHLVGLSAGTGVNIWALEHLRDGYKVDNVILLSSSLSHQYDVSKALRHVKGKMYNYYSTVDSVLTVLMQPIGTIDGKLFTAGAGAVGLEAPDGSDRVVNIPWKTEFKKYGYYGGHTDSTSARFVRKFIAPHIVKRDPRTAAAQETAPPTVPRSPVLADSSD